MLGGMLSARACGNLPRVAPIVLHHATAVTIRHRSWFLERACASIQGASIRRVRVGYVDVQKGGHHGTDSRVTNHHDGVANPDLRWSGFSILSLCVKHLFEKPTSPFASVATILGVIVCQPLGAKEGWLDVFFIVGSLGRRRDRHAA